MFMSILLDSEKERNTHAGGKKSACRHTLYFLQHFPAFGCFLSYIVILQISFSQGMRWEKSSSCHLLIVTHHRWYMTYWTSEFLFACKKREFRYPLFIWHALKLIFLKKFSWQLHILREGIKQSCCLLLAAYGIHVFLCVCLTRFIFSP